MKESLNVFDVDKEFLYDALSSNSEDYIFIWNIKQDIAVISDNMVSNFGFADKHVNKFMFEWCLRISDRDVDRVVSTVNEFINGNKTKLRMEYQARNIKGEYWWIGDRALLKRDAVTNEPLVVIGILRNLEKEGRIDSVTGLYTHEKCKEYFDKIELQPYNYSGSLLIIGMDDFATINTLNNHSFGDMVLRFIVQDIQKMLPEQASIYRFDGDQFAIVGDGMSGEQMFEVYSTIKDYVHKKREINGQSYSLTVSGGIISYPEDGIVWADISKGAAIALKKAKETGKNKCVYYAKEMLAAKVQEQLIGKMLAESVDSNFDGFKLMFQPVTDAKDMSVVGAEALLRFVRKKGEVLPPDLFIPILENTNLIVPVGLWVLEEAIKTCRSWLHNVPDFVMHVNVSYLQLRELSFCEKVANLLSKYNMADKHIVLELTESYFITDAKNINLSLAGLKDLHLKMAMDDFGTGYSSLARLATFNVDVIKIDKAFVQYLHASKYNYDFIESVVRLCHNLGMKVCVEGVETFQEQKIVSLLDVDYIQGYYVSRPIDADVFYQKFIMGDYDGSLLMVEPDMESLRNKLVSDKGFLLKLMNASPLAMSIWSKNLDVMFCNKECLRLFGVEDDLMVMQNYFSFSPEYQPDGAKSVDKAQQIFAASLVDGYAKFSWVHEDKNGERIPSEVTITRITYQDEFILVSHIRDMREQVAAEEKLLHSSRKIKSLLDATPMCLNLWSRKMENTMCNKVAVELFDLKNEQEYIDRFFELSPEYQPDGQLSSEKAAGKINEAFEHGRSQFRWMHCKLDGEEISSEITLVKIEGLDDDGTDMVAGFTRDMRPQLAIEQKIRQSSRKIKSLLDATPMCLNLWNRKMENTMCNKVAVELFDLKNEQEYIDRFFELSPEYQPDGQLSSEKAAGKINEAFEHGRSQFRWMHCKLDGEEISSEITLVKIEGLDDDGSDMVAGATRDMRQQLEIEGKLRKTNSRIKAIFDATPLCLTIWNKDMEIVMSNKETAKLFELPSEVVYAEKFFELSPLVQPNGVNSTELAVQKIKECFETGYEQFSWIHCKLDGEQIPAEITLVKIEGLDDDGGDLVASYTRDIRQQLMAEKMERVTNKRIKAMLDASPLACLVLNLNGDVIGYNQAAVKMFGATDYIESLQGLYPMYQPDGSLSITKKEALMATVMQEEHISFEWMCMNKNKENIPCEVTLVRLRLDDEDIIVSYNQDLREIRRTLEVNSKLKKIAYYDVLTGCSSRAVFMDHLQEAFNQAKKSEIAALIIFDLDNFKLVNDSYGHDVGDITLKKVTDRVKSLLPSDAHIGRYGGDEFMVLIKNMPPNELQTLLNAMVEAVAALEVYSEQERVHISISAGATYITADDESCDEVIKRADIALYEAKDNGRNCTVFG